MERLDSYFVLEQINHGSNLIQVSLLKNGSVITPTITESSLSVPNSATKLF